jgi:hypothetical protein
MQEDKLSKWLADQLRTQQEENQLPYDLGAWEAFESRRAAKAKKKSPFWISGIAAAVIALLVAGGVWLVKNTESIESSLPTSIALEEGAIESRLPEPAPMNPETETAATGETLALNSSESKPTQGSSAKEPAIRPEGRVAATKAEKEVISKSIDQSATKTDVNNATRPNLPPPAKNELIPFEPIKTENLVAVEQPAKEGSELKVSVEQSLVASNEEKQEEIARPDTQKAQLAKVELPKDPLLSDAEIEEMLVTKSFANIAMGVSPGFGSTQGSEHATAGTSLGLGVMVDMPVVGKLVMGSGVAVNYLNQASESQSYNYAGISAASSTVKKTDEISQLQLDIPLYVKYPITGNQRISVQAGFSNLITFNQGAAQEETYTRQVAVYDALPSNSFKLQSESVSQTQDLSVANQKFYPFATANFGINIRLFEAKKTSYEVMPFYNYPLQEISGYGEKLGMFGASFKVNFGAFEK